MGIFDTLANQVEQAAIGAAEAEARTLAAQALARAPGGLDGLVGKLVEGGLGAQVAQWRAGDPAPVTEEQLQGALGEQTVQTTAQSIGVNPGQLLTALAQHEAELAALLAEEST